MISSTLAPCAWPKPNPSEAHWVEGMGDKRRPGVECYGRTRPGAHVTFYFVMRT